MTKEEAKQKYKNGEIKIRYDINNEFLLRELIGDVKGVFYRACYFNQMVNGVSNENTLIINLSEIEDEFVWLGSEMQFWYEKDSKWVDCHDMVEDTKYRLKPKPEYTAEIEALQNKAKENGMKAVITFEKL